MSRGRTDILRVNLPAQQDTTPHRDTVEAQRMHRLMQATKAQQPSSSHNHCPCATCQVNNGFLFCTSPQKNIYIQVVTGGTDQTSGECSLC